MVKIFGNYKVQKILDQAAKNRNFGHAFLLQGPSGLGKREMAKDFAGRMLGEGDFSAAHPDLFILDGKGEMAEIAGIENIRQMRDKIMLSCQRSKVKVVLGLDINLIKKESLNAFLKSLEEPLPNVVFALTASSATLKTIESRCAVLRCSPLSAPELSEMAAETGLVSENLEEIANASMGKPGLLINLVNQSAQKDNFMRLADIIEADIIDRFNFAEKIYKELDKILIMLYNWIGEGRRMLAAANDRGEIAEYHEILKELAESFERIKQPGANEKRILENLFLNI